MFPLRFKPSDLTGRPFFRNLFSVALFLLLLTVTGAGDAINRAVTDRHFRWRAVLQPTAFPKDLLVIAVDDRTPSPTRADFAAILNRLRPARVVAIDYLLDEKSGGGNENAALALAMARQRNVLLPLYLYNTARPFSSDTQTESDRLLALFPKTDRDPADFARLNSLILQPPAAILRDAAAGFGLVDINAGPDNIYRQPILFRRADQEGAVLPHLALALAVKASGRTLKGALADAPETLSLADGPIPLMAKGSILLPSFARRPNTPALTGIAALLTGEPVGTPVPEISFEEARALPPEAFRDKILLIGETRTASTDIRPVATDNGLRGVELTAQIAATLLRGDRWQFVPGWLHLLLLLVALLPLLLYSRASLRHATIGALLALAGLILALEGLFHGAHFVADSATLLGAWVASTLFCGQQRAAEEYKRRERLRSEFSAYVAPEMVEDLLRQGDDRWEIPRRHTMAILFSDIRGFTTYSQSQSPEVVHRQLTEYLGEMTEVVFEHRGFVDKFIGDAVMALFDPFRQRENPSAVAVLCALDMQTRLEGLNQRWAAEGLPPWKVGIGIHKGEVLFGNMGSERRKTLTAIGDSVNVASRIEGATKDYQAAILISESIKHDVETVLSDRVFFQEVGPFSPRGHSEAIRLYSVLPRHVSKT